MQPIGGTLRHTAKKVSGQKDASHGGKSIKIRYLSGTTYAKEHFTVTKGGGFDFIGEFKATVARGTWPASWLTAVDGWPPEVDMAEWKGSGESPSTRSTYLISGGCLDVRYPDPGGLSIRSDVNSGTPMGELGDKVLHG